MVGSVNPECGQIKTSSTMWSSFIKCIHPDQEIYFGQMLQGTVQPIVVYNGS